MLTKTRTINKQKNDLETNHSFPIPKNIQKDINEKGFALYNWIGEQDVKQSIERDFLKLITKLGTFFSLSLIIPSIFLLYIQNYFLFNLYFFGVIFLINVFLIFYLIGLSIKRSTILRKNSQILITDTSVSINGKIRKLENGKIVSTGNLDIIGELFEEKLFEKSNIYKTKKGFKTQVIQQIKDGYSRIFEIGSRGKQSPQLMIIFGALYSVYALSLGFVYIFGIFFIWIFGNILSIINKKILLISGHQITTINTRFEKISLYSKNIVKQKEILTALLTKAMQNEWKDSLLFKINDGIKEINNNAEDAIETNIKLKKDITDSKYNEMFNFSIYNSWIKEQLYIPLKQIYDLLELNLNKLKKHKQDIEEQISTTSKQSLQGPLLASQKRTQMSINGIEKHIVNIEAYINKLI